MKKSAIAPTICVFLLTLFVLNTTYSIEAQNSMSNSLISSTDNTAKKTIIYDDADGLILSVPTENIKKINIFNKGGRKLISITKFDKTIYLRSLRSGSYQITIELKSGEVISRKLIKP